MCMCKWRILVKRLSTVPEGPKRLTVTHWQLLCWRQPSTKRNGPEGSVSCPRTPQAEIDPARTTGSTATAQRLGWILGSTSQMEAERISEILFLIFLSSFMLLFILKVFKVWSRFTVLFDDLLDSGLRLSKKHGKHLTQKFQQSLCSSQKQASFYWNEQEQSFTFSHLCLNNGRLFKIIVLSHWKPLRCFLVSAVVH